SRHASRAAADIDDARDRPAEAHVTRDDIEQRERHVREADPAARGLVAAEAPLRDHEAATEAELRLLQRPAAVGRLEQGRAARHRDGAPGVVALRGDRDPLGRDVARELEAKAAAAPPGE